MNFNELASKVAKIEGGKSNAKICDIREILRITATIVVADYEAFYVFYKAGVNHQNKKKRDKTKTKNQQRADSGNLHSS